jgi:hypothetical protein
MTSLSENGFPDDLCLANQNRVKLLSRTKKAKTSISPQRFKVKINNKKFIQITVVTIDMIYQRID